ncbi:MAG: hypothetical protein IKB01_00625 [Lachnospiraceae bacterium]|nr:hypothetical protein [Lachnospiraceae bacterium]
MGKELDKAYVEIDNFRDKLGEILVEELFKEDNTGYEMAKSIMSVFDSCDTKEKFKAADGMLIAICGWSIDSLIEQIKQKDAANYVWESCA